MSTIVHIPLENYSSKALAEKELVCIYFAFCIIPKIGSFFLFGQG